MEQQHTFIVSEADNVRSIFVDGVDISDDLYGAEVHMLDGQATALMLYAKPESSLIHSSGFIYVQSGVNGTKLDDLNPAEIEQEAMNREEWGSSKTLVENIIDIVKEKLLGA